MVEEKQPEIHLEAQFEEETKPSAPAPQGELVEDSKAALEDVNVVIPEGMTVKSNFKRKKVKALAQQEPDPD